MQQIETKIAGYSDGQLLVRQWVPDSEVDRVANLHILHGMAEHSLRYRELAEYLTGQGITVIAHDHRQHGYSLTHDQVGILDKTDTWQAMVEDIREVQNFIQEKYGEQPIFMLGHSMGSLLARSFLQNKESKIMGAILTGSPISEKGLLYVGLGLSKVIGIFKKNTPSQFLDQMAVGVFNKEIEAPLTDYDWISQDREIVDRYAQDPLSGYPYNSKFYGELSRGSLDANNPKKMKNFAKIPLLFISGVLDPCGKHGKGVRKLAKQYITYGVENTVTIKESMRHEVINELERKEVYEQINQFIQLNRVALV